MKHPLQQAIERRGYTINQLAARANVPVSNIYNITRGRSKVGNMGISAFMRIAHALGMTADELLAELDTYDED